MKYKVWDKKNNCWAPNAIVYQDGLLYLTFGYELKMINDPENYEVFWEIVHRGVRAFVGDVVDYNAYSASNELVRSAQTGMIKLTDEGLFLNGLAIRFTRITKVLGHSKDLKWN